MATSICSFTSKASGRIVVTPAVEIFDFGDSRVANLDIYYNEPAAVANLFRHG